MMTNLKGHLFLCFALQDLWCVLVGAMERREDIDRFRGRTTLVDRASDGGCSLLINRPTVKHNGKDIYSWVDNVNKTDYAFYDWMVTLEGTDITPRPWVSVNGEKKEGGNITVSCSVLHTCPYSPPALSFRGHRGALHESHIDKGQGEWQVFASITFVARAEDHGKTVACSVMHPGGQTATQEVVLNVNARPTNVSISQLPTRPLEGETVTLTCLVDSFPPVRSYRWYSVFGQRAFLLKGNSDRLSLSVTRDVGQVRCCAVNDMGETSSATTTVNVEYAPAILPLSFCSINDSDVRCECVVDSHPMATIIWTLWIIKDHHVYNITDPFNWRILRSVLTAPRGPDVGHVLCNSTNEHGSASIKLPFIDARSAHRSLYYGGLGSVLLLFLCLVIFLLCRFYFTKRDNDGHIALGEVDL